MGSIECLPGKKNLLVWFNATSLYQLHLKQDERTTFEGLDLENGVWVAGEAEGGTCGEDIIYHLWRMIYRLVSPT